VRVRFFVAQAMLPKVHIGDPIAVRCDGCRDDLVARVSFISAQAEFTPPVIYSQEERARLVFRIEALPEKPEDVRVGQPVSVALRPAAGVSHARK
jgi:HlyD family secretion protein